MYYDWLQQTRTEKIEEVRRYSTAQDTQDRTPRQDKQDNEDRTSWTVCSAKTVNDIGNNKFAKLENKNQYYNIELCVWIEFLGRIDQL